MPHNFISATLLVCERVLDQPDGILSAIRIVDAFSFESNPKLTLDEQPIEMQVLVITKFQPGDHEEHSLQLELIRPDGAVALIGDYKGARSESQRFPQFPGGINLMASVRVVPTQMGTHYWRVTLDGEVVAMTPFSIFEKTPDKEQVE